MISVVHGPEVTRCAPAVRVLALLTLSWTLVGCPAGSASADACAYASTGPDGTVAVAWAGGDHWPTPPPCPKPTPPPCPPTPAPRPKPAPRLSSAPVSYPAYHPHPVAHTAPDHTTPVTYVLLITVPAIVAVAALRPR
ncbi:hypothetical protein ADK64_16675 [Streptomyces sp. MMG1121]|nr:hypothetical protein ADK64_16675 [Streptomyces sp. MMG1121]